MNECGNRSSSKFPLEVSGEPLETHEGIVEGRRVTEQLTLKTTSQLIAPGGISIIPQKTSVRQTLKEEGKK